MRLVSERVIGQRDVFFFFFILLYLIYLYFISTDSSS